MFVSETMAQGMNKQQRRVAVISLMRFITDTFPSLFAGKLCAFYIYSILLFPAMSIYFIYFVTDYPRFS